MKRVLVALALFAGSTLVSTSVEAAKPHAAKVTKHKAKAKKVAKKTKTHTRKRAAKKK